MSGWSLPCVNCLLQDRVVGSWTCAICGSPGTRGTRWPGSTPIFDQVVADFAAEQAAHPLLTLTVDASPIVDVLDRAYAQIAELKAQYGVTR